MSCLENERAYEAGLDLFVDMLKNNCGALLDLVKDHEDFEHVGNVFDKLWKWDCEGVCYDMEATARKYAEAHS